MSYRELRSFTENLRVLGYPRAVSVNQFNTPHFELIADILEWLTSRLSNVDIADSITTMQERVAFIKNHVAKVFTETHLKLNPRKLYQADRLAARELLKLSSWLVQSQTKALEAQDGGNIESSDLVFRTEVGDVKTIRMLCGDLTERGLRVHEQLNMEQNHNMKARRAQAVMAIDVLSRNLDSNVEPLLGNLIQKQDDNRARQIEQLQQLEAEKERAESQLEKKTAELERLENRMKRLGNIRPAWMDEADVLQKKLSELYAQYVIRFRNMDYLEHELDKLNIAESEQMEESARHLKNLQMKMREKELNLLRGDDFSGSPPQPGMQLPEMGADTDSQSEGLFEGNHNQVGDGMGAIAIQSSSGSDDCDLVEHASESSFSPGMGHHGDFGDDDDNF